MKNFATFTSGSVATFAQTEAEKPRQFEMLAYSGGLLAFGARPAVIDLAGMTIDRDDRPVFRNHDRSALVGHSTRITKQNDLRLTGIVSGASEAAKQVVESADAGFKWQASVGINIGNTRDVREGETVKVNGETFAGPLLLIESSNYIESSFAPLGADGNTHAAIFALQPEGTSSTMNTTEPITTITQLRAAYPTLVDDLRANLFAEIRHDEMARFAALRKAFPNSLAFALDAFERGYDVPKAKGIRAEADRLHALDNVTGFSDGHDPIRFVPNTDYGSESVADLPIDEIAKAEFADDPKLRVEFRTEASYIAYRKAHAAGGVAIYGRPRTT